MKCHSAIKPERSSVLFVTRKWAPAVGGMETYSEKLTEALQALVPVQVLALSGEKNGLPPTILRLIGFFSKTLARLLTSRKPLPLLHLGDMVLWPLGLAAKIRHRRTRVVLSAHGTDVAYHRRGGLKGWAYGTYLRVGARLLGSAKVIANSDATRDVARETGWRHIEVVPLATDMVGPVPTGQHGGHILFAGRLVERKGCGWFIRDVLPLLTDTIRLKVAGTGWDASESSALDNPRVDFLGSLRGQDLVDAYRNAMCVIVPNIEPRSGEYEGFGLVATEAAAAGGLVLAARTGGLVQAVDEGVTGMLLPQGDGPAWAEAIHEIVEWDGDRRKAFLTRSLKRCREYYSWDRVAHATHAIYESASDTGLRTVRRMQD